ncbi:hypothetical protein U2F26_34685 [Micromonospora sp. 4G57]|uniref:DUF2690 domain-containing protein n=1 Tax=Micromonospora sicca TaxID=2202420 RepID=A0ABU5JPH4_9ACTN|nr:MULTISPECIES: hypothetical protein [unclassified Micromonospora]MDZ5447792.1 hypothetical protein [Micromonospora sp. 4G57]MDZ5494518.1 hypothetical protein [Micromonospora sp. 4G53]
MRRNVTTAVTVVALLAGSGCGRDEQQSQAAHGTRLPTAAATTASPTQSPAPALSPGPILSSGSTRPPAPTPAWSPPPCPDDLSRLFGTCGGTFLTDSCDAAYRSSEGGYLLDAFIENKNDVNEKRLQDCPQFLPTWRKAKTGISDGNWEVGKEVKPGTYQTTGEMVKSCYWERSGPNGHIIANNFITATKKVRVTIRSTDEIFTARGCGNWIPVG